MFRPRFSTEMHHIPGLSAASLQIPKMTAQIGTRLTLRSFKHEIRIVFDVNAPRPKAPNKYMTLLY